MTKLFVVDEHGNLKDPHSYASSPLEWPFLYMTMCFNQILHLWLGSMAIGIASAPRGEKE